MATETGLLPTRSRPEYDTSPMVISVRRSGAVFDALSPQKARMILTILAENPMTASEVAETVGTSLQNTTYHTNNLLDAGVLQNVDIWYSEKGRKMDVYAPSCEKIVLTLDHQRGENLISTDT